MVVSGLPLRNRNTHASQIATMSLHLLSGLTTFTIPHLQDTTLQLRIGIHTGMYYTTLQLSKADTPVSITPPDNSVRPTHRYEWHRPTTQ